MTPCYFNSVGVLHYENIRDIVSLRLLVSQDLMRYYHHMIPRSEWVRLPGYRAHLTVVRKRYPEHPELWGKHEGRHIPFIYTNKIDCNHAYCWIDAYSRTLEEILDELGLPGYGKQYVTSKGVYNRRFHVTVGLK